MAAPTSSKTGLFYQPSGKCAEREGGGAIARKSARVTKLLCPALTKHPRYSGRNKSRNRQAGAPR